MQTRLAKQQTPVQTINRKVMAWSTVGLNEVEVLVELGLTSRQARVYVALLKIGSGKAKAIADCSLVNRQEVYRVLESLQQIGLVQKNVCVPTTYVATPVADVVKVLLKQKAAELTAIRKKTRQLAKRLQNNSHGSVAKLDEALCLGTVFEGERGKKYHQAISGACQSIDMITSWKRFKQLINLLEVSLQQAFQKHVYVRIATEKLTNQILPAWIVNAQVCNKNRYLELKILSHLPAAAIAIFDHTTAAVAFHPNNSLTKGPDLWTTNPTLLALSQTCFNSVWAQSFSSKI